MSRIFCFLTITLSVFHGICGERSFLMSTMRNYARRSWGGDGNKSRKRQQENSKGFKQERARILYVNPKYAKDFNIFTFRESRRSPYLTSLNLTLLVPLGDNVTFHFEFMNLKLQAFPIRFDVKVCEGLKMKWIKDWVQTYSDIPLECPVMPGSYRINKFELPPKNFPISFNKVDYSGKTTAYVFGTKEKICELSVELRFNTNDRKI